LERKTIEKKSFSYCSHWKKRGAKPNPEFMEIPCGVKIETPAEFIEMEPVIRCSCTAINAMHHNFCWNCGRSLTD
jgi:hypothetical protein